jgi:hypothetical protein
MCNELSVPLDALLGRRAFLRLGAWSAAFLALGRLRGLPAAQAAAGENGLWVLSPTDARRMLAVADRITFTGDPAMPRFAETEGLAAIDTALLQLPPDVPEQLSWALLLFEYGPPVTIGRLSTYSRLSPEWQDIYLMAWEQSRFQLLRLAFQAFKNLAMLGYYAQDATWGAIHYRGPWAPRPRRVVVPGSEG